MTRPRKPRAEVAQVRRPTAVARFVLIEEGDRHRVSIVKHEGAMYFVVDDGPLTTEVRTSRSTLRLGEEV